MEEIKLFGLAGQIIVGITIGLLASIISTYLYSLEQLSLFELIIVIAGFLVLLIIITTQTNIREIKRNSENQNIEIKRLNEKFKMHEMLIDMRVEIKELQREVFK